MRGRLPPRVTLIPRALGVSLDSSAWWSTSYLDRFELGGIHLAHRLHHNPLGLEKLVEPAVLILLNGRECVDSVDSYVHFDIKGSDGSARPAQHSYTVSVLNIFSQFQVN